MHVAVVMRSALQKIKLLCDSCHSWVHASCEGLEDKRSDQLTQLTFQVENLAYYCKLNQCGVGHKKFLYEDHSKAVEGEDAPTIRSLQAKQVNVHHIISEMIDAVQFQNVILCSQIQATSESCFLSASLSSIELANMASSSGRFCFWYFSE